MSRERIVTGRGLTRFKVEAAYGLLIGLAAVVVSGLVGVALGIPFPYLQATLAQAFIGASLLITSLFLKNSRIKGTVWVTLYWGGVSLLALALAGLPGLILGTNADLALFSTWFPVMFACFCTVLLAALPPFIFLTRETVNKTQATSRPTRLKDT